MSLIFFPFFFSSRISYILVYIVRKDVILSVNRQCAALLFYNNPALWRGRGKLLSCSSITETRVQSPRSWQGLKLEMKGESLYCLLICDVTRHCISTQIELREIPSSTLLLGGSKCISGSLKRIYDESSYYVTTSNYTVLTFKISRSHRVQLDTYRGCMRRITVVRYNENLLTFCVRDKMCKGNL